MSKLKSPLWCWGDPIQATRDRHDEPGMKVRGKVAIRPCLGSPASPPPFSGLGERGEVYLSDVARASLHSVCNSRLGTSYEATAIHCLRFIYLVHIRCAGCLFTFHLVSFRYIYPNTPPFDRRLLESQADGLPISSCTDSCIFCHNYRRLQPRCQPSRSNHATSSA